MQVRQTSSLVKNFKMETTEKFVRKFCKVKFVDDDSVAEMADLNCNKIGKKKAVIYKKSPIKVSLPINDICDTITDFTISSVKTRSQVKDKRINVFLLGFRYPASVFIQ